MRQLADLTKLVRGDLSSLHRRIIAALITIDVHARDIVDSLHSGRTTDINSFQWQMQLRYYFENEDLIVRQVNARFMYAYEYLGAQARLVVTPMTDRCYLTLTGALHLKLGGAPAGPAGETQHRKALGRGKRGCAAWRVLRGRVGLGYLLGYDLREQRQMPTCDAATCIFVCEVFSYTLTYALSPCCEKVRARQRLPRILARRWVLTAWCSTAATTWTISECSRLRALKACP